MLQALPMGHYLCDRLGHQVWCITAFCYPESEGRGPHQPPLASSLLLSSPSGSPGETPHRCNICDQQFTLNKWRQLPRPPIDPEGIAILEGRRQQDIRDANVHQGT